MKTEIVKMNLNFEHGNYRYSVPLEELGKDEDIQREYDLHEYNSRLVEDTPCKQLFDLINDKSSIDDMSFICRTTVIYKPGLYAKYRSHEKTTFNGWVNIKESNESFKRMTKNAGPRD